MMKRTQMYFDDDEYARLQARAESQGRSAAALVRDAVADYLSRDSGDDDPILGLIHEAESTTRPGRKTDSALNHDHYLYGRPKEGASRRRRNG